MKDANEMKVSDAVRRLNPDVFMQSLPVAGASPARAPLAQKPRLRQDRKGPNKLEREFEAWLRDEWKNVKGVAVEAQALTLTIANGSRFTPDFIVAAKCYSEVEGVYDSEMQAAARVMAFETKGFMRDDAAVKIKVAARMYPWIKFHLVTKRKKKDGGGWAIEEVLP